MLDNTRLDCHHKHPNPLFPICMTTFTATRIGSGYPNDQAMSLLLPRCAIHNHNYQAPQVGELQTGSSTTSATCISASGTWMPSRQHPTSSIINYFLSTHEPLPQQKTTINTPPNSRAMRSLLHPRKPRWLI